MLTANSGVFVGDIELHMIPQHLAKLIQAVKQVSPELVTNCRYTNEENQINYLGERSFAYELYRQWENLIEDNNEDMVVNAEIPKKYQKVTFIKKLIEIFGLTSKDNPHLCFYPDLVFHHSQFDSEKQEIICEIKTMEGIDNKKNNLNQDLKKLAAYMTENALLCHPFNIGVFILVGGSISEIKNRYRDYNLVAQKSNDIYCLSYNIKQNDNSYYIPDVVCMSLNKVLNI